MIKSGIVRKYKGKGILHMSILEAVLLGIIQGITEFLPVSSSAHLVLAQQLLNIQNDPTILFDLSLHLGTLAAVIWFFHKDLRKVILSLFGILQDLICNLKLWFRHRSTNSEEPYRKVLSTNYRRLAFMLVISAIPTAVIGFLMRGIAVLAFESLLMPGILFFITVVMLLVADMVPKGKKIPRNMKPGDAVIAGVFQGCSVLPGISSFGTGFSACLLAGFSRKFAVKYSMLMSIPAVIGGMILELTSVSGQVSADPGAYIVVTLVSAVVAFFSIRTMLRIVSGIKPRVFAFYCVIVGVIFIAVSFAL